MTSVENVSEAMTRSTGVKGTYYSIFDGKDFWYIHRKEQGFVTYNSNFTLERDEEVNEFIAKTLKENNL